MYKQSNAERIAKISTYSPTQKSQYLRTGFSCSSALKVTLFRRTDGLNEKSCNAVAAVQQLLFVFLVG